MIHTNRCKYCGKTKVEHEFGSMFCPGTTIKFRDSGLAALDAHKEELWGALRVASMFMPKQITTPDGVFVKIPVNSWNTIQSILNQIEKEK